MLSKNNRLRFFIYRAIHRRDRLMTQLFYLDNKRYEWVKQELNLTDYKLRETYGYKRETRYERFLRELKETSDKKRQEKLALVRQEFEQQKETFFKEKQRVLLEIQRELKELGFENLKFSTDTSNANQNVKNG